MNLSWEVGVDWIYFQISNNITNSNKLHHFVISHSVAPISSPLPLEYFSQKVPLKKDITLRTNPCVLKWLGVRLHPESISNGRDGWATCHLSTFQSPSSIPWPSSRQTGPAEGFGGGLVSKDEFQALLHGKRPFDTGDLALDWMLIKLRSMGWWRPLSFALQWGGGSGIEVICTLYPSISLTLWMGPMPGWARNAVELSIFDALISAECLFLSPRPHKWGLLLMWLEV